MQDRIERTQSGAAEEWVRRTDDLDLRGVLASRYSADSWGVGVHVAEFVREEPLESELRTGVDAALRAVPGVRTVDEEDREVWFVTGDASGEALVRAVSEVVDRLAPRVQAEMDTW